jgi:2-dehydropantoate 2-reductase
MRTDGLRVISTEGPVTVPPGRCVSSPAEIGPVDVVLFCVKSYDTATAARQLGPLLRSDTIVLSLQNGVENEDLLRSILPTGIVFGGVAYIYSTVSRPGEVTETAGPKKIVFGPLDGPRDPSWQRARDLLQIFNRARINAELADDIIASLWKKFIFITGAAGVTALTRLTLGEILAVEPTRTLLRDAMAETDAVAHARGVHCEDGYVDFIFSTLKRFDNATRSSLYHDLMNGKPMEIDALSGTVVRYGAAAGVPTPIHRTIYAALLPYHQHHTQHMTP